MTPEPWYCPVCLDDRTGSLTGDLWTCDTCGHTVTIPVTW